MKKIVLFFIFLLTGCATYDLQNAIQPSMRVSYPKLPNLEPVFEAKKYVDIKTVMKNTDAQSSNGFATLFKREAETNLADTGGESKGKLVLTPIFFENRENTGWLKTPMLIITPALGVPTDSYTAKWELELSVLDKSGKQIARYSANAEKTEYKAAYWGWENPRTAATFESYKTALDSVIKQLQNDIPQLSAKLK